MHDRLNHMRRVMGDRRAGVCSHESAAATAVRTLPCGTAGILHFSHNPNCQEAAFLANFATKDPGTQTMWCVPRHDMDLLHAEGVW